MSDRNPWAVLGLAVGTTDELEIRRAYADRVRASPPEKDPEGFRRARDAYELLRKSDPAWLRYLADEARGRDPDESYDDEPEGEEAGGGPNAGDLPVVAPPQDDALVAGWTTLLESALAQTDAGRAAAVRVAVASAARQAAESPARSSALAGVLRGERFEGHEAELAGALPAATVRASLERGDGALAAWAVDALSLAGNTDALGRAAEAAAALEEVHDPAALHALVGLARAAALVSPKSAKRLADLAWTLALPGRRPLLGMETVDVAAAAAEDVADWPPVDRALLARIVYAGGVEGDVDPKRFHAHLARSQRSDQARRLVAEIAPELMPPPEKLRKLKKPPEPKKEKSWVQGVFALMVLIGMVSRLGQCGEPKSTGPLYDTQRYTNTRRSLDRVRRFEALLTSEEQRELDEFHGRIARRDQLSPSGRKRFEVLTARHLRSKDGDPIVIRPLFPSERNEMAAYQARVAAGEVLSEAEKSRAAHLMKCDLVWDHRQEHPPDPGSGGR